MTIKDTLSAVVDLGGGAGDAGDTTPEAAPDALAVIKDDHDRVSALFKRALADDAGSPAKMRPVIAEIVRELETHAKMEETIFYPALRKRSKAGEDRERVFEAIEEHGTLKDLIKKIKKSTGRDETLKAKVAVLSELVEHHVREEENEMFGEARRLLGESRLRTLGEEMAAFKKRATRGRAARKTKTPKAAARA